jgi:hypothetical protein
MLYLVLYMMRSFTQILGCQTFKSCIIHGGRFLAQALDAQIMNMLKSLVDCHIIWV